ncbi:amidohydrolase family protein [Alicycliphilus sp. B1]|nr:amidohydrolase family protein [Alicycliphilus sp. B1]
MNPLPTCPEPLKTFSSIGFDVPPLACDTHAHVVSDDFTRYPLIENRSYTSAPAPEAAYLRMLDQIGMQRGVLVQISTYGTDNRCMLATLARHPERLRGVAVIDRTTSRSALEDMHALGVRGVRINTLLKGGVGYEQVEAIADLIAPLGWHLQFLMHVRDLLGLLPMFTRLPVPGVVDHMGDMHVGDDLDGDGFRALCELVRDHGWWAKLSAAYRMGVPLDRLEETMPIARRLLDAAPERMLWGSDWPHVNVDAMPDTGALLNLLESWVPDAGLRRRILVENPARLYGFPG